MYVDREERAPLQYIPHNAAFSFRASSSLTKRPWSSFATSSAISLMVATSGPMSETYTPLESNGYEPTRTPADFVRACRLVRNGAMEDSGSLQEVKHPL